MDFKVLIADSATADLKQIVEFVAEDNPEAAIRLGEKLLGHALSLGTLPERFPFHDRQGESARCWYRLFLSITNAMNRLPL
jgi:plasmid stabilization system protein ParE